METKELSFPPALRLCRAAGAETPPLLSPAAAVRCCQQELWGKLPGRRRAWDSLPSYHRLFLLAVPRASSLPSQHFWNQRHQASGRPQHPWGSTPSQRAEGRVPALWVPPISVPVLITPTSSLRSPSPGEGLLSTVLLSSRFTFFGYLISP